MKRIRFVFILLFYNLFCFGQRLFWSNIDYLIFLDNDKSRENYLKNVKYPCPLESIFTNGNTVMFSKWGSDFYEFDLKFISDKIYEIDRPKFLVTEGLYDDDTKSKLLSCRWILKITKDTIYLNLEKENVLFKVYKFINNYKKTIIQEPFITEELFILKGNYLYKNEVFDLGINGISSNNKFKIKITRSNCCPVKDSKESALITSVYFDKYNYNLALIRDENFNLKFYEYHYDKYKFEIILSSKYKFLLNKLP